MSEQKKREQNDVIKAVVFASIVIIIVLAIIWVFSNKLNQIMNSASKVEGLGE